MISVLEGKEAEVGQYHVHHKFADSALVIVYNLPMTKKLLGFLVLAQIVSSGVLKVKRVN